MHEDRIAEIASLRHVDARAALSPDTTLGEHVRIGPGVVTAGRCRIGDGCHIAAGTVLDAGDDTLVLEPDVCIMAGAIVAAPVRIGHGACLRPGAVVTRDVPPHAIVAGNPAEIVGYTTGSAPADASSPPPVEPGVRRTAVRDVTLHRFPRILDLRGNLTVGEFGRTLPFEPRRYFMVFGVPNAEVRGEHAHRTCKQFLICAHGRCSVVADDGHARQEFLLDDPSLGLYLPPLTWGVQYKYSHDAVLLVFASEFYDPAEYIRDYSEFLSLARGAEG